MKFNKKKQIEEIADQHCLTTTEISCTKCGASDFDAISDDMHDVAHNFYNMGWRVTEKNCYCPKCAKKHLKQSS